MLSVSFPTTLHLLPPHSICICFPTLFRHSHISTSYCFLSEVLFHSYMFDSFSQFLPRSKSCLLWEGFPNCLSVVELDLLHFFSLMCNSTFNILNMLVIIMITSRSRHQMPGIFDYFVHPFILNAYHRILWIINAQ